MGDSNMPDIADISDFSVDTTPLVPTSVSAVTGAYAYPSSGQQQSEIILVSYPQMASGYDAKNIKIGQHLTKLQ